MPVIFKCPATGQPLRVSIRLDQDTFAKLGAEDVREYCPHCGEIHTWRMKNGELANEF